MKEKLTFFLLLRRTLAVYLEDIETPAGRAVNLFILGLILLSSVIFVAQTYQISDSVRNIIDAIDRLIGIIFVTEYLLRLWCADEKIKFFFRPFFNCYIALFIKANQHPVYSDV